MDTAYIFNSQNEAIQLDYKHTTHDSIDKNISTAFPVFTSKVKKYVTNDTFIQKILHLNYKIATTNYLFLLMKNNGKCIYIHYYEDMKYNILHCNNTIVDTPTLFGWFIDVEVSPYLYSIIKDLPYCDREIVMYKYNLKTLSILFDYLEIGGNFLHSFIVICKSFQLEYMYLLTFMFKKVVLVDGQFVCCYEFLGNTYISQEEIIKLIHKPFTITNKKNDPVELTSHIEDVYKYYIKVNGYLLKGDTDKYLDAMAFSIYKKIMNIDYVRLSHIDNNDVNIQVYKLLIDVLKRTYSNGKIIKVNSAIKSQEGNFIEEIIQRYQCKSCLEVGMAFGVSAMYILSSSKDTTLISIDPFQSTQWNNYGINLLKMIKTISRHTLIEEKSFIALPKLLDKHKFDFIFIDGWHTFDYTLIDFFYSLELLKDNGIIIIDDALHKGVGKCVKYIETNYPHCRKLVSPSTVACFKKVKKDTRDWNFHVNF